MAINTFLQGLGATHLWTLNNVGTSTSDDLGNSSTPSNISSRDLQLSSKALLVIGVTHSVRTEASTSTNVQGAVFDSKPDINQSSLLNYREGSRSILLWFRQEEIQNPSCIYEQGGGTNNFALMGEGAINFSSRRFGTTVLWMFKRGKNLSIALTV